VGELEPTPAALRKIVEGEPVSENEGARELACPWCDSEDVEMVAEYGPHLMVSQYICRGCKSPFEVIRR
jgi:transposase-like protein